MARMKGRRGFTLIELLVVVVIIGILASIGVGGYAAAMEKSRNSGVVSNVRTIFVGLEQWKSDHTGLPAELTGLDHDSSVCSETDPPSGTFPTNYVPGGRLPVSPWTRLCQIQFLSTPHSSAAGATRPGDATLDTPNALAIGSGGVMNVSTEGFIDDGGEGTPGRPPLLGEPPKLRRDFGYVYYIGDTSSSRYAIFGIGKVGKIARAITVRANYQ